LMNYRFTKGAMKDLREFEIAIQKRIIEKLDFYMAMDPLTFAKSLRDNKFGEYRFRVGEYRVIFDVRDGAIIILMIGHRRDIYR
jgi:mRNA interferase RelE/StbE